jgi:hypothetical protein
MILTKVCTWCFALGNGVANKLGRPLVLKNTEARDLVSQKKKPSQSWHTSNGWQAFAVHDGIVVKEAKAAATKALELAAANEAVVVAASALALQLGDEPDAVMKGVEITLAIKFVYVAFPLQPTPKSSHSSKAAGLEFLGGLGARWPTFLPAARAACVAASAAASADDAAADAAAAAAASLAPPAAPIVLPASNTAAAIDLGAMSEAEQRALLARLVDLQAGR